MGHGPWGMGMGHGAWKRDVRKPKYGMPTANSQNKENGERKSEIQAANSQKEQRAMSKVEIRNTKYEIRNTKYEIRNMKLSYNPIANSQ